VRRLVSSVLAFLLPTLITITLNAQTGPSRVELRAQHDRLAASHVVPVGSFEQVAPYWTAEGGWHTELQLRNNLASGNLIVTPSLRIPDGTETALTPMTLLPGEVQSIDLNKALTAINSNLAGQANAYGSVVLRYNSKGWRNLYASVMVHDSGRPIMYHLDAVHQAPKYVTGSREGIWWLPTKATHDYLILTNQSDHLLQGTLWLYDSAGKPWSQPLQLGSEADATSVSTATAHHLWPHWPVWGNKGRHTARSRVARYGPYPVRRSRGIFSDNENVRLRSKGYG
jgi:hypothetical protein